MILDKPQFGPAINFLFFFFSCSFRSFVQRIQEEGILFGIFLRHFFGTENRDADVSRKKKGIVLDDIYTISPVFLVSRETNQSFPLVHLVLNFVAGCGLFRLATDHCANKRQPDPYHGTIKSPTWKIKHLFSALLFIFFSSQRQRGGPDKVEEASRFIFVRSHFKFLLPKEHSAR